MSSFICYSIHFLLLLSCFQQPGEGTAIIDRLCHSHHFLWAVYNFEFTTNSYYMCLTSSRPLLALPGCRGELTGHYWIFSISELTSARPLKTVFLHCQLGR
jgi:hypothetical protein